MKSIILILTCASMLVRTSAANPISGVVKGTDGSTITGGIVSGRQA